MGSLGSAGDDDKDKDYDEDNIIPTSDEDNTNIDIEDNDSPIFIYYSRLRNSLDKGGYRDILPLEGVEIVRKLWRDLREAKDQGRGWKEEVARYKNEFAKLPTTDALEHTNIHLIRENSHLRMAAVRGEEKAREKVEELRRRLCELEDEKQDLKLILQRSSKNKRNKKLQDKSPIRDNKDMGEYHDCTATNPSVICPICLRLRNLAQQNCESDATANNYFRMSNSRINNLQMQIRTLKTTETQLNSLIAQLKSKVENRDREIDKLRQYAGPAASNSAAGSEDKKSVDLKSTQIQIELLQSRNAQLENKLKQSILKEHSAFMSGSPNFPLDRDLLRDLADLDQCLSARADEDEFTLHEKLIEMELQLSKCCKEKAELKEALRKSQGKSDSTVEDTVTTDGRASGSKKRKPSSTVSRTQSTDSTISKTPEQNKKDFITSKKGRKSGEKSTEVTPKRSSVPEDYEQPPDVRDLTEISETGESGERARKSDPPAIGKFKLAEFMGEENSKSGVSGIRSLHFDPYSDPEWISGIQETIPEDRFVRSELEGPPLQRISEELQEGTPYPRVPNNTLQQERQGGIPYQRVPNNTPQQQQQGRYTEPTPDRNLMEMTPEQKAASKRRTPPQEPTPARNLMEMTPEQAAASKRRTPPQEPTPTRNLVEMTPEQAAASRRRTPPQEPTPSRNLVEMTPEQAAASKRRTPPQEPTPTRNLMEMTPEQATASKRRTPPQEPTPSRNLMAMTPEQATATRRRSFAPVPIPMADLNLAEMNTSQRSSPGSGRPDDTYDYNRTSLSKGTETRGGTTIGSRTPQGTGTEVRSSTPQGTGTTMTSSSSSPQGTGTTMRSRTGQTTGTTMQSSTSPATGTTMQSSTPQATGMTMTSGTPQTAGTTMRSTTGQTTGTTMQSSTSPATGTGSHEQVSPASSTGYIEDDDTQGEPSRRVNFFEVQIQPFSKDAGDIVEDISKNHNQDVSKLKSTVIQLQNENHRLQTQVQQLRSPQLRLEEKDQEISMLKELLEKNNAEISRLHLALRNASYHRPGEVQTTLNRLERENAMLNSDLQRKDDELKKLKVECDKLLDKNQELNKLRNSVVMLDRSSDNLRAELDRKDEKLAKMTQELEARIAENARLKLNLNNAEYRSAQIESNVREVQYLKNHIDSSKKELEKLRKERDEAVSDCRKLREELLRSESGKKSMENEYQRKSSEADELKKKVVKYVDEVRRIEEILGEKVDEMLLKKLAAVARSRADNDAELSTLLDQYHSLSITEDQLTLEASAIHENVREAVDQNINLRNQLTSQNSLLISYEQEIERLSQNVVSLESEVVSLRERSSKTDQEARSSEQALSSIESKTGKLRMDLSEAESKVKVLVAENDELKHHIEILEDQLKQAIENRDDLEMRVSDNDIATVRSLQDLQREKSILEERLESIQTKSETLLKQISQHRLDKTHLQTQLERVQRELQAEKGEREVVFNELQKLQEQLNNASTSMLLRTAISSEEEGEASARTRALLEISSEELLTDIEAPLQTSTARTDKEDS